MLTNLRLKMMLMITYLSHWDWILYKSRKDLVKYIQSEEIHAMCPNGVYREDCLLYTSPSPRDVEESRMPSSA